MGDSAGGGRAVGNRAAPTPTASALRDAIHAALVDRDMAAAAGMIRQLAVIDPDAAAAILDAVTTGDVPILPRPDRMEAWALDASGIVVGRTTIAGEGRVVFDDVDRGAVRMVRWTDADGITHEHRVRS